MKFMTARAPFQKPQRPVDIFSPQASAWWDVNGPAAPLHRMNPARLSFIRAQAVEHFGRKDAPAPLKGLAALDVGCGAGIACEPLARLGAEVTGLDLSPELIAAAKAHAADQGLDIHYVCGEVFKLKERFDLITALEVLEHVDAPQEFLRALVARLKPDGLLILSTPARTAFSFLITIVGAEYLTRKIPRGTHDWRKFWRSAELQAALEQVGLRLVAQTGLRYDPLTGDFSLSADHPRLNILLAAVKGQNNE